MSLKGKQNCLGVLSCRSGGIWYLLDEGLINGMGSVPRVRCTRTRLRSKLTSTAGCSFRHVSEFSVHLT